MSENLLIELKNCDERDLMYEAIAKNIATYFSNPSHEIFNKSYCEMLNDSVKWDATRVESEFEKFKNSWISIYENLDISIEVIISYLEIAFLVVNDKEQLNKLRGFLFELMLVGIYGGQKMLEDKNQKAGWGVSIIYSGNELIYSSSDIEAPNKRTKQTFDYIYIKEKFCYFYECKIRPSSLRELDLGYLQYIQSFMDRKSIANEKCIFMADVALNIEIELADIVEDNLNLIYLGYDTINAHVLEVLN